MTNDGGGGGASDLGVKRLNYQFFSERKSVLETVLFGWQELGPRLSE